MKQIFVMVDRCMGCRSCELSCAVQHSATKNLAGAILESPPPRKRLFVEQAEGVRMPVLCRHCDDAPCLNACISGCLYRDERGLVQRHRERCIGCWSCIMTCPFGVITRDRHENIAVKCDGCHKLEVPACVNACPTKALVLMDVDDIPPARRKRILLSAARGEV